jgi:acylphosphatase
VAEAARRAVHLAITGRVQAVGYRAFVERVAAELGLRGWVRNRRDGSVEAVVAGPAAAVESLIAACRKGPAGAAVTEITSAEWTGREPTGFTVLPTS